jgi:SAM-dependent methyltransferase
MISHEEQQRIWDEEHAAPVVLKQMDSDEVSSSVVAFFKFLSESDSACATGIEMGCGKGRNTIWLARHGVSMCGFDFSENAITEAVRRADEAGVAAKTSFLVQDATKPWRYDPEQFDFGIDCFASTDIESEGGRIFAIAEMHRALKPGGYLMAYLLSPEDEFHKEMIAKYPAHERGAFIHPTGKFEKTFDDEEIAQLFKDFEVVRHERWQKTTEFSGKKYACTHHWLVFQKPSAH